MRCASVSPKTSVERPSTSTTTGPLALPMPSSSRRHPSAAENHQKAPGAGPRFSVPVTRLPEASAFASFARPYIPTECTGAHLRRAGIGIHDVKAAVEADDELAAVGQDDARRQALEPERVERRFAALEPVQRLSGAVDEVEPLADVVPTEALAPPQHEVSDAMDGRRHRGHAARAKRRISSARSVGWSSGVKL